MSKHPLPKKLQDELDAQGHYKPNAQQPPTLKKTFDDSMERAMYDEILGPILPKVNNHGKLPVGSGYEATKYSSSVSNSDFTSSLLQRLRIVENEAKESRQLLSEQISHNLKLEEEIKQLQMIVDQPSSKLNEEMLKLKSRNLELEQQISEMEEFLADYGLVWVGKKSNSNTNNVTNSIEGSLGEKSSNLSLERLQETEDEDCTEENDTDAPHLVDYLTFERAIKELNDIIYSEPAKIVSENKKARIAQVSEIIERISITYYKNGILVRQGPFRYCASESYHSFIRDIIDGYFPSEYSKQYPDGVLFDLIDKREVKYSKKSTTNTTTTITTAATSSSNNTVSTSQFLNRLPKVVVSKDGNIVDIRGDIAKRLNVNSTNSTTVEHGRSVSPSKTSGKNLINITTEASEWLESQTQNDDSENNIHSRGKVTTIQIKLIYSSNSTTASATASETLVAKMFEMDTILTLKEYIRKYLPSSLTEQRIELRTTFPSKVLTDGMTMHEANLVPNGTVHAKLL